MPTNPKQTTVKAYRWPSLHNLLRHQVWGQSHV